MILQVLSNHSQTLNSLLHCTTEILSIVKTLAPGESYSLRQHLATLSLELPHLSARLKDSAHKLKNALAN